MSLAYLQQESTPLHPDSIWGLQWTAKNHIISGAADGHVRVFDATTLTEPLHDIAAHPLAISALTSSSDGSRALSVSLDGTVALIDAVEGRLVARVETGREKAAEGESELPAFSGALHPEQKCWAWSGRSSKVAIRSMETEAVSEGENGEASATSAVGRGVLGGTGKVIETGKGKFGMDLQFSPDGQSLALGTETGHIVVVDVESQAVTATYTSHSMAVRTLSWSQDSQWLFSGSDDNRIILHDVRAGQSGSTGSGAVAIMQGHQGWVLKVASSPDAKLLGSGGADGLVKLWDIGQRTCVSTNSSTANVWGFAWQPVPSETFAAGKQFVVGGDDRGVTLYRAAGAA